MKTKIYVVHTPDNEQRLVRAKNKSAALAHVVRNTMRVHLATQEDLVSLVQIFPVEDAEELTND